MGGHYAAGRNLPEAARYDVRALLIAARVIEIIAPLTELFDIDTRLGDHSQDDRATIRVTSSDIHSNGRHFREVVFVINPRPLADRARDVLQHLGYNLEQEADQIVFHFDYQS